MTELAAKGLRDNRLEIKLSAVDILHGRHPLFTFRSYHDTVGVPTAMTITHALSTALARSVERPFIVRTLRLRR